MNDTLALTADGETLLLLTLPKNELRRALLPCFAGYSDAELADEMQFYKDAYEYETVSDDLAIKIAVVASCVLEVVYNRGLPWAIEEVHRGAERRMHAC